MGRGASATNFGEKQVAKVVQEVTNRPSLQGGTINIADIPKDLVGGTLGDNPWRSVDAI